MNGPTLSPRIRRCTTRCAAPSTLNLARAPDRRVVYTVVIALSDGGDTAMRILGQEAIAFTGEAGSGVAFLSELWHRTERASEGVWKLAIFYGYMLGTRRPRAEPSRAP